MLPKVTLLIEAPTGTIDQLEATIHQDAHASARTTSVAAAYCSEALEQTKDRVRKLICWKDIKIKSNLPPKLKVSPVAAVPHKF